MKSGLMKRIDASFIADVAQFAHLRKCTGRMVRVKERYEINVSELRKVTCKTEYKEKLKQRWEMVQREVVRGVEGV